MQPKQTVLSAEEEVLTFSITANLMPEQLVNFDTFAYLTGRRGCELHDTIKLCYELMFSCESQQTAGDMRASSLQCI